MYVTNYVSLCHSVCLCGCKEQRQSENVTWTQDRRLHATLLALGAGFKEEDSDMT